MSAATSIRHRLTVIASLYVSQAIPLGFFIVALPAILRQKGLALEQVGLLGALAMPWLLKFLWGARKRVAGGVCCRWIEQHGRRAIRNHAGGNRPQR